MKPESPKSQYLRNDIVSEEHRKLTANPHIQNAVNFTLLQMAWEMDTIDMTIAAQQQFMLKGAKRFATIFLTLADIEKQTKPVDHDNLPHAD